DAVAREVADFLEPVAQEQGRRFACESERPVAVCGAPDLLKRLVLNLVDNAFRHTPPSAAVRLAVHADDDTATIEVNDDGPGIPATDLPRVFERFRRGRGASAAAGPLALDEALARARAAGPTLRIAAAELEAARGRLRQARLVQANPVLSADLARHTAPAADEDAKDRGVQLEQEIEVGGQRGLRIAAAEHDVTHAEHLLADRRRTVEGEVRRAFFALAAAERRQKLAAERLALASRLAEAARRRTRAGETGALDARLAEVETARAAQETTAAEAEHARAEGRLATAIGAEPGEPLSASVEDMALAHRRAAEEAWRRYEREALPAATQARDLLERGYDAGYLSLADVLVQEDRLLQVRAGAIDAWLDLHDAEAEVIEAAGAAP